MSPNFIEKGWTTFKGLPADQKVARAWISLLCAAGVVGLIIGFAQIGGVTGLLVISVIMPTFWALITLAGPKIDAPEQ